MAALQNPVASLQSPTTCSTPPLSKTNTFSLSFSSSTATFNPLRLSAKLAVKPRGGRRGGGGGGALGARMSDSAAGRYAAALADVASSNGTLEATSADVELIDKIFSDEQVYDFFANPVIAFEKKRAVLDEIVGSSGIQPHTANFLNILVDAERIELIKDILKEFEVVYNELTGTELAVVTSVVQLENEHLAQIAKGVQKLTGAKNVRIKTVLNPDLVAGFTIRYGKEGSKLVDMSVKKQLEEIAAQLDLSDVTLAV